MYLYEKQGSLSLARKHLFRLRSPSLESKWSIDAQWLKILQLNMCGIVTHLGIKLDKGLYSWN